MATDRQWARAYALQALSDLRVRDRLVEAGAEKCHRLHYLQMGAEKVCKVHLTMGDGHANVRKTHAYVKTVLPIIARRFYSMTGADTAIQAWQLERIRSFSREIEVIAPACNAGDVRDDNSEYPWLDGRGDVQILCLYSFPRVNDGDPGILLVIRLIHTAAEAYSS